MKRNVWLGAGALAGVFAAASLYPQGRRTQEIEMPPATAFRVTFGLGDTAPKTWDGKVRLAGGGIVSIQGTRFAGADSTDYKSSWKAATRHGPPGPGARRTGQTQGPMLDNGVILTARLDDERARFDVETAQGSFSFTAQEVPYGTSRSLLGGRVSVERVPPTLQLNTSDEEQDFPALAQTADAVYVAYVDFTHGDRAFARAGQLTTAPANFDFLARPAGGDQVKLMRYNKAKRVWSAAEDVSAARQDVMRAAVAVDAKKRVWVIWSANQNGNFDLYAKWSAEPGKWSAETRLSTDPGTDVNPVAASDAQGRVWVAWQGYRNGSLDVLAAVLDGDRFGMEQVVSVSKASDWDPAIAASKTGEVAVSWDTYDKGDYDVYARRMRYEGGVKMEAPQAVAASTRFEARSAAAYDAAGRLWVAYEGSEVQWGKDFGAYETSGVALYQGHNVRVRCLEGGRHFGTEDEVEDALPGPPNVAARGRRRRAGAQQAAGAPWPNPQLAAKRAPSATPQPPPLPMNSFPRLAAGQDGLVYLAYRTVRAGRTPVGSVWEQAVLTFDGAQWHGPVPIPHSDGLLDARPAMAALGPGHLLAVVTTDHRMSALPSGRLRDGVNTDLYAAELRLDAKPQPAKLKPVPVEKPAASTPEAQAEIAQVSLMRNYRAAIAGKQYQVLRGEFHRHTEMSGDGGRDGPLIDAYRYMIDAAYMDWGGCCDHDNGGGREYYWWLQQKLTDAYKLGERFVPMFSYERSVRYPEGHRNVVMPRRGVRPLPRLPKVADDAPPAPAPDTQMLYRYLRQFSGIAAVHTSGTDMGTDWRDNDPVVEPVVEIYQGDRQNYEIPGGPRSNKEGDSIGGWRPLGFVSLALQKGYRLGFQASSDHISTHMSYCNLWVAAPTREAIMDAFYKRRIYGATDNILADVRVGQHFMGEEFSVSEPPAIEVKLWGAAEFAKVHVIKDNQYVYTAEPNRKQVEFTWRDSGAAKGKTSYYYVRGEQKDGELVWVSPMWITYR